MRIFEFELFWITVSPSYYWLMYALWFIAWYIILKKQFFSEDSSVSIFSKKTVKNFSKQEQWDFMDSLLFHIFFWVVIWWRVWYMLLYNAWTLFSDPLSLIKVWEWWMSFHWWFIWVLITIILFARKNKLPKFQLWDNIATIMPIWLWLWRFWNYLNKELLWFGDYYWPLAVVTASWSYFPSSLLELLLEWIVLYFVLNFVHKKKKFHWQVVALFFILYWVFRIFVELFFRQPDAQIGYIFSWVSLWTLYSIPMVVVWIALYIILWKKDIK